MASQVMVRVQVQRPGLWLGVHKHMGRKALLIEFGSGSDVRAKARFSFRVTVNCG